MKQLSAISGQLSAKADTSITLNADEVARRISVSRDEKSPLTCRLHTSSDGGPLRTEVAKAYPQMTRRQRRQLVRVTLKARRAAEKQRNIAEGGCATVPQQETRDKS